MNDASGFWQPFHGHEFDVSSHAAKRKVTLVFWVTVFTMVLEIVAGWKFDSMALLADGWHMGSHALALGLAAFAYGAARRLARDKRFAFGTWKIEVLAGFSSALFLVVIAGLMVIESTERFFVARPIHYPEAMAVAALGLVVNVVSAFLLLDGHEHGHNHDHNHGHGARDGASLSAHGHDLNLRSAYAHVVTDAATSILALVALAGGWWLGLEWLDPLMGIIGALVIALWAKGLLAETSAVLLDREMEHPVVHRIRSSLNEQVTAGGPVARVLDFHAWRVGRRAFAVAVAVEARYSGVSPALVRQAWSGIPELVHSTVEIHDSHALAESLGSPGGREPI